MLGPKTVLVVGTGTIGEPLLGLLCNFKAQLGIDEVLFHKRTPLLSDRSKVQDLLRRGARLVTDKDRVDGFAKMGLPVEITTEEALEAARVVVDCTPSGNAMKERWYQQYEQSTDVFIAQGSEFGFGKPYARGINDDTLKVGRDKYLQVVSCNTHNLSVLIKTFGLHDLGPENLVEGRFMCMRRANDISQTRDFAPAPQVGKHDDAEFGTHHAHDAYHLFETLGLHLDLFSSAVKLNTQYMHSIWFNFQFDRDVTKDEMVARLKANVRVATTDKRNCNEIFSFGRDHGYYGRILSQTVVVLPTLAVRRKRELYGFCFTPQDGNSLLSSVAAALWLIEPDQESLSRRLDPLRRFMYQEI